MTLADMPLRTLGHMLDRPLISLGSVVPDQMTDEQQKVVDEVCGSALSRIRTTLKEHGLWDDNAIKDDLR